MNAQLDITRIPLQQLALSPRNARKTTTRDAEDLAASIAANGLLQNLIVIAQYDTEPNVPAGYEVVAGGRRLAALQLLQQRHELPADLHDGIPVRIIHDDAAIEASTAENTLREAMHPADQFDAFKAMVDARKSIPDVAAHFGVPEVVVKQRLKLANVAPDLVQLYRDDEMNLEQLQALAITDDHEAQRKAWITPKYDYERSAHALRRALTQADVSASSAIAGLVGVDAYLAAGGTIRNDLFSERDEAWLTDAKLLDALALDKLEAIAQAQRDAGWSWAEAHLSLDYAQANEYPRLPEPDGEPQYATPEDAARAKQLIARLTEIEETYDDEIDREQHLALSAEDETLQDELGDIEARMVGNWSDEAKAGAGVLVYLDHSGLNIEHGRLRPGQKVSPAGEVTGKAKPALPDKAAAKPKKPELSADNVTRLNLQRAAACRVLLTQQPLAAVQLLTAQLVESLFFDSRGGPFDINARHVHKNTSFGMTAGGEKFPDLRKAAARQQLADTIKATIKPGKRGEVLAWIQSLDAVALQQVQALCAAVSLENLPTRELGPLANALGCDMAQWWQADGPRYLANVSKALILEAVTEARGKPAAEALANLKRDPLIAEAAKQLAGTGWLPKPLRGAGYALAKPAAAPAKSKKSAKAAKTKGKKPAAKKAPAKKKSAMPKAIEQ